MRYAASQFRSKAERVAVVVNRLDVQVGAMVYAGPAADQFRSKMSTERYQLQEVLTVLGRVADVLNDGASRVEADSLGLYSNPDSGSTT
jgi:uncharacterized protein YukE